MPQNNKTHREATLLLNNARQAIDFENYSFAQKKLNELEEYLNNCVLIKRTTHAQD